MLIRQRGQIICLLIFILLSNLFLVPLILQGTPFASEVRASSFSGEDVLKGAGVALALIVISQTLFRGREDDARAGREEQQDDWDYDRDDVFEPEEIEDRIELTASDVSKEEIDMLARVVYGESRGEPFEGQVAVAAVVLNRVRSYNFPDEIEEVIFQEGQFIAVEDGQFDLQPGETSYQAVIEALEGEDPSRGAYYFYNPVTARTFWWLRTREKTVQIGNHIFAR